MFFENRFKIAFFVLMPLCIYAGDAKPIIAFDLHGVVLHYQKDKIMPYLWNFPQKWELAKGLVQFPFIHLCAMLSQKPSFEQVLDGCCKHNSTMRTVLTELSAFQAVDPEMKALIFDLNKQGYELDVVSNIGAASFTRLKQMYPEVFAQFRVTVTSDMHDENGALIKKPDARFFGQYLNLRGCQANTVIFVDDRKENAAAAKALGFDAIVFENAKQLKEALKVRKIIPEC